MFVGQEGTEAGRSQSFVHTNKGYIANQLDYHEIRGLCFQFAP
jgi:hypothetical protein